MKRIWTAELAAHTGQRVRLAGRMHRLRQLSNVTFLILRDAKVLAQIVIEDQALIERLAGPYHESVLMVEGLAVASAQVPGCVELHEPPIEIIAPRRRMLLHSASSARRCGRNCQPCSTTRR